MQPQPVGAVAPANEEAVRAWDTVLYERWKKNRKVFVGALDEVTEDLFDRFPPPAGGRCIDIGCGFGETTQQLAGLVGPEGFALGTDSSPRFIEDARREAAEAGVENVEFEVADAQTAAGTRSTTTRSRAWERSSSPRRFRRCGRSAVRSSPAAGCARSAGGARTRARSGPRPRRSSQRFLSRPDEYEADTCGPGPFSLGNPGDDAAASSRPPGSRRSICTRATSRTTWARTWTRRSTRCWRSGPGPS